jgi:hypothetical protein
MKRVGAMLAIGVACVAVAAAQTGTPQTSSSPQTTARSGSPSGTITVVGCLQRGDMSGATGTTGATSGSTAGSTASRSGSGPGSGASFILTNASMSTPSGTSSTAGATTSGTTGSTAGTAGSASGSGSTYVLEGSSSDLSATNVGKRVEVTGTLSSSASTPGAGSSTGSTTSGTTSATGSGSSTSGSMSNAQHLRVSSVRLIGSDCSR